MSKNQKLDEYEVDADTIKERLAIIYQQRFSKIPAFIDKQIMFDPEDFIRMPIEKISYPSTESKQANCALYIMQADKRSVFTLYAEAGYGKTTWLEYHLLQWSQGKVLRQHDLIFHISAAEILYSQTIQSKSFTNYLAQLLLQATDEFSEQQFTVALKNFFQSTKKVVTITIDGFEELLSPFPKLPLMIQEIFELANARKVNLIVTTRKSGVSYLNSELSQAVQYEYKLDPIPPKSKYILPIYVDKIYKLLDASRQQKSPGATAMIQSKNSFIWYVLNYKNTFSNLVNNPLGLQLLVGSWEILYTQYGEKAILLNVNHMLEHYVKLMTKRFLQKRKLLHLNEHVVSLSDQVAPAQFLVDLFELLAFQTVSHEKENQNVLLDNFLKTTLPGFTHRHAIAAKQYLSLRNKSSMEETAIQLDLLDLNFAAYREICQARLGASCIVDFSYHIVRDYFYALYIRDCLTKDIFICSATDAKALENSQTLQAVLDDNNINKIKTLCSVATTEPHRRQIINAMFTKYFTQDQLIIINAQNYKAILSCVNEWVMTPFIADNVVKEVVDKAKSYTRNIFEKILTSKKDLSLHSELSFLGDNLALVDKIPGLSTALDTEPSRATIREARIIDMLIKLNYINSGLFNKAKVLLAATDNNVATSAKELLIYFGRLYPVTSKEALIFLATPPGQYVCDQDQQLLIIIKLLHGYGYIVESLLHELIHRLTRQQQVERMACFLLKLKTEDINQASMPEIKFASADHLLTEDECVSQSCQPQATDTDCLSTTMLNTIPESAQTYSSASVDIEEVLLRYEPSMATLKILILRGMIAGVSSIHHAFYQRLAKALTMGDDQREILETLIIYFNDRAEIDAFLSRYSQNNEFAVALFGQLLALMKSNDLSIRHQVLRIFTAATRLNLPLLDALFVIRNTNDTPDLNHLVKICLISFLDHGEFTGEYWRILSELAVYRQQLKTAQERSLIDQTIYKKVLSQSEFIEKLVTSSKAAFRKGMSFCPQPESNWRLFDRYAFDVYAILYKFDITENNSILTLLKDLPVDQSKHLLDILAQTIYFVDPRREFSWLRTLLHNKRVFINVVGKVFKLDDTAKFFEYSINCALLAYPSVRVSYLQDILYAGVQEWATVCQRPMIDCVAPFRWLTRLYAGLIISETHNQAVKSQVLDWFQQGLNHNVYIRQSYIYLYIAAARSQTLLPKLTQQQLENFHSGYLSEYSQSFSSILLGFKQNQDLYSAVKALHDFIEANLLSRMFMSGYDDLLKQLNKVMNQSNTFDLLSGMTSRTDLYSAQTNSARRVTPLLSISWSDYSARSSADHGLAHYLPPYVKSDDMNSRADLSSLNIGSITVYFGLFFLILLTARSLFNAGQHLFQKVFTFFDSRHLQIPLLSSEEKTPSLLGLKAKKPVSHALARHQVSLPEQKSYALPIQTASMMTFPTEVTQSSKWLRGLFASPSIIPDKATTKIVVAHKPLILAQSKKLIAEQDVVAATSRLTI